MLTQTLIGSRCPLDSTNEIGFGAEVITDGGVVALPRGLADPPVRYRINPVLGENRSAADRIAFRVLVARSVRETVVTTPVNTAGRIKSSD